MGNPTTKDGVTPDVKTQLLRVAAQGYYEPDLLTNPGDEDTLALFISRELSSAAAGEKKLTREVIDEAVRLMSRAMSDIADVIASLHRFRGGMD